MNPQLPQDPRNKTEDKGEQPSVLPDVTPRREGGDDALAEKVITDTEADEKVITNNTDAIANEQIVNASGNNAPTSGAEIEGSDKDIERVE